MRTRCLPRCAIGCFCLLSIASLQAADWPGFRGDQGGIAADTNLPVQWTKDNILWKIKLPGLGASSPIVSGDKVFVTCYSGYGTELSRGFGKGPKAGKGGADAGDEKKLQLLVLCVDRNTGQILWQKEVAPKLPEMKFTGFMKEHGYASSTPVTDGERVYVFFGKTGVLAFDLGGKQLWHVDVGSGIDAWGSAASPILHKDLVIVNAAIESNSLIALDKKTGKELWRVKDVGKSWSTPIIVTTKEGNTELVLSQPGKIVGYNPQTGKELWHCQGIGVPQGYSISSPVAREGVVFAMGGGGPMPLAALAVRAGGTGDVTKTHVLWRKAIGSGISSPVFTSDHVVWVAGVAQCVKAADGDTAYKERLYGSQGEYVSAILAGDKIFALTRFDGLFVLAGGGKFEKLAHNEFPGDNSIFNASPAVSNGRMYIRSNDYLYCIGTK